MIAAPVLIPAAAACLALVFPRWAYVAALGAAAATAGVSAGLAVRIARAGAVVYEVGGWPAPLGIALRADGLAAVMLLLGAAVALPVFVYAASRARPTRSDVARESRHFWPLALLLCTGLNAIFLAGDIFNVYVALELMTLAAVALILLADEAAALQAAMRYLLAAFVGSMLYLLGAAVLYSRFGTLDLTALSNSVAAEPSAFLAAALVTVALALKSALFPLHFWLPRAHAAAPAPVSALLSSLVVTASVYLFLRLWTTAFAAVATAAVGQLVGVLGAAAILWGSLQALRQQHLKVMIAYSTVAQVGYLFLLVPLVSSALVTSGGGELWGQVAWSGGIYHAITHALAKAAMFLAAGALVAALGSDRIVGISGIARELPVATYAFGIAGMTLIGLPPSGGFVAKWLLLTAAFQSGQWWWAIVMLVGGILTAGYVFLVLGQELSLAGSDREVELASVPRGMEYAAFALAIAALVLGVRTSEPLALLRIGAPFGGP